MFSLNHSFGKDSAPLHPQYIQDIPINKEDSITQKSGPYTRFSRVKSIIGSVYHRVRFQK